MVNSADGVRGFKWSDGTIWLVTQNGRRLGPFHDMDAVLDTLGAPNPENEALADTAWALMV